MQAKSFLYRVVREPLLHFVLIGAAVFMLYPGGGGAPATSAPPSAVIEVTPEIRDRLAAQFAATWNREPSPDEIAGLMADHVKNEVLYREALALGLDRDDPVIRQRLRLKMEFIGEGVASALVPAEADLAAWYATKADSYAAPATVSFAQVMLADPGEALAALMALGDGADPATLGRATLLPAEVEAAAANAVDGTFGAGFFDTVAGLDPGIWAGPVESAFGVHLVRLGTVTAADAPPLDAVRDVVIADWRREQATILREAQYQAFLARYDVRLPDDGAVE